MPNLYSSREIITTLEKKGFIFVSQKGSHIKMRKEKYTVIIPAGKKQIPFGTFRSIVRQSGLNDDDFI